LNLHHNPNGVVISFASVPLLKLRKSDIIGLKQDMPPRRGWNFEQRLAGRFRPSGAETFLTKIAGKLSQADISPHNTPQRWKFINRKPPKPPPHHPEEWRAGSGRPKAQPPSDYPSAI